jgi:N-acetylglucosamine-6-phosphate deacetylase
MLFRANPAKCILITDSIELAGLPDGTYPGHAQVSSQQTKKGTRVVIEGTETLIGSCISLRECAANLLKWSGCSVAEAVKCVTENIADFMGETEKGKLEEGRCADLVVLDDSEGLEVVSTWIRGRRAWPQD